MRDIYSAEGTAVDPDTPLVVLVNRGTASASEVSWLEFQNNVLGRQIVWGNCGGEPRHSLSQ